MQDFKKLKVWEKSHQLCLSIYKDTRDFPKEELFGIVTQMRRSSSSIPTNIAEGCGRGTQMELNRFIQISLGSLSELEYQIILSKDLGYFDESQVHDYSKNLIEIRKMLFSLKEKVLISASK